MSTIEVDNVVKQFDGKRAVDGVSFAVRSGSVFGLLGPNGAGKTTLIRMLVDILRPDSGSILYDGRPLDGTKKDRLAYLPEERGLYRKERVADLLVYFARLKGLSLGDARARVATYLDKLEMTEVAARRIEELSKGNQQKIQIAGALVGDPDVILLDEPFSGLDPLNVRLGRALLDDERRAGKTILLSTHQMNQVEELCDSLLMIHEGRAVLYGAVGEILRRFSDEAIDVVCTPFDPSPALIERVAANGRGVRIFPRAGVSRGAVLADLLARGVEIESFERASTPLEEIFVRVVRTHGGAV